MLKKFGPIPDDLGKFWQANSVEFPLMSKLARQILSLPASSAENERWFSKLKHLVTENRENLSSSTINNIVWEERCYLRKYHLHHNRF